MSIASELNNYRNGLDDAWDAAEDMGATIPHDRNMNNLDDAIRTIPVSSPNDGVLTITQNGTTVQTFSANQATNVTAALTDTTYSDFTGATSSAAGAAGVVPAPAAGDQGKVLTGDGSWTNIFNLIYPVGSIYMSVNNTDPGTLFGGTWVAWGAGRVPVGVDTNDEDFDTVEETGGEKTHTLVNNELPKIEGTLPHTAYGEPKVSGAFSFTTGSVSTYEGANNSTSNKSIYKLSFGNNAAHNNLQPYITCYMWKRTA